MTADNDKNGIGSSKEVFRAPTSVPQPAMESAFFTHWNVPLLPTRPNVLVSMHFLVMPNFKMATATAILVLLFSSTMDPMGIASLAMVSTPTLPGTTKEDGIARQFMSSITMQATIDVELPLPLRLLTKKRLLFLLFLLMKSNL
jgi:hypothetical protein